MYGGHIQLNATMLDHYGLSTNDEMKKIGKVLLLFLDIDDHGGF